MQTQAGLVGYGSEGDTSGKESDIGGNGSIGGSSSSSSSSSSKRKSMTGIQRNEGNVKRQMH
jgi:hypothetical protein